MNSDGIAPAGDEFLRETLGSDCAMYFRGGALLERVHSPYQLIEVYATPQWGKLLRLDGCNMTSEKDEFIYHEALVHPAAISHPSPRQALIIGGGDGGCAEELLKYPSIAQVTMVELDQSVVDIAKKHFEAVHHRVFDNPRLQLRIGDGFAFLRETAEHFDLITLDLTDPVGAAAELYTPAMFAACKRALTPDGVLSLHVGSPYFHAQRFQRNLDDLASIFKMVRPYLVYIPTYGAPWGFATASDTVDPHAMPAGKIDETIIQRGLPDLRYFSGAVHQAAYALPHFLAAHSERNPPAVNQVRGKT